MNDLPKNSSEDQKRMEDIYKNMLLHDIPWNSEMPPDALIELVDSGTVNPCKCIDLGCGAGNYAIYLAKKGFDATGVDFADTAIEIANENVRKAGVKCTFIRSDILGDMAEVNGAFDFAYDWGVLHHIYPENRDKYVKNVQSILNSGGKYLSMCFSEKNVQFDGTGKYRKTPLGTVLYFSDEQELKDLFSRFFRVIELKTIEISGKFGPHIANYALLEKKNK